MLLTEERDKWVIECGMRWVARGGGGAGRKQVYTRRPIKSVVPGDHVGRSKVVVLTGKRDKGIEGKENTRKSGPEKRKSEGPLTN